MILLGDKNIPFENISYITSSKDIENTKPNSTVLFDYDMEMMKYCEKNGVEYGIKVTSIKDTIYANALSAKYIICPKELSSQLQEIATNYMFDSKILAVIEKDNEIEDLAIKNVDGVIYKDILE